MVKRIRGFTLLELLVVIALISLVSAISLPYALNQIGYNVVANSAKDIASLIYLAQQDAYNGRNDKNYGVKFNAANYSAYIGPDFGNAEATDLYVLDTKVTLNPIMLSGGATDINFTQGSLEPSAYGTISVTDSITTFEVIINSEGHISYRRL